MLTSLPLPNPSQRWKHWRAPDGAALALLLAETARTANRLVVAITKDTHEAHLLEADLATLAPPGFNVLHLPDWETLPYDLYSPHPDIISQRVATLARLELRPDEIERTLRQLNGFFSLVAQMEAVNTIGVEPLAHPAAVLSEVALRLRDDIASEPDQRDASQASAPAIERGLFLVPKVIE